MVADTTKESIKDIFVHKYEKRKIPDKHYVFVVNVRWSDDVRSIVYRRYGQFYKLQISLLKAFPRQAGAHNPTDRILPFLPGKVFFTKSRTEKIARKRLPSIDEYCKVLTSLPSAIRGSTLITDFFTPHNNDIHLDGSLERRRKSSTSKDNDPEQKVQADPKWEIEDEAEVGNEVEDEVEDEVESVKHVAVTTDFMGEGKSTGKLTKGDRVSILDHSEDGWKLIENEHNQDKGWVPASCLNITQQTTLDRSVSETSQNSEAMSHTSNQSESMSHGSNQSESISHTSNQSESMSHASHQSPDNTVQSSSSISSAVTSQEDTTLVDDEDHSVNVDPEKRTELSEQSSLITHNNDMATNKTDNKKQSGKANGGVQKRIRKNFVANQDFEIEARQSVRLKEGQRVTVLDKDDKWWYVESEGQQGWAPADYLQPKNEENHNNSEPTTPTADEPSGLPSSKEMTPSDRKNSLANSIDHGTNEDKLTGKPIYVTRSFYQAAEHTETSLEAGEYVVVLEKTGSGWWCVSSKAGEGWVPSHYLMNPMKLVDLPKNARLKTQVQDINTELHPTAFRAKHGGDNKMIDCVNKSTPVQESNSDITRNDEGSKSVKDLRKMFGHS